MIPGEYTANKNKIALASLAEKHLKNFPRSLRERENPQKNFPPPPVHKTGV